jgi:hypothetical protein
MEAGFSGIFRREIGPNSDYRKEFPEKGQEVKIGSISA